MCLTLSGAWRKLHQPRVYLTVEPVLFLYSFASFLSYAVFQELLHHIACQHTPNCPSPSHRQRANLTACGVPSHAEQLVQATASHWLLYANIASGVPAIVVSLFFGAVSDVKGRKAFMILPAVGSALNQAVVLLVIHFSPKLPLPFLLLGSLIMGVSGNFPVFNFAVYSYVSDVSAEGKRTVQIGILESMTFLGATLSLLVGGRWVNNTHFSGPLFCVLAINLVIVVYIIIALPESLDVVRHRERGVAAPPSLQRSYNATNSYSGQPYPGQLYPRQPTNSSSPCSLLRLSCDKLVSFLRLLFSGWKITLLLCIFFVVEINFLGITDTVILFALGSPLCWGTDLIGYFLSAKVFLNGLATLFLLPLLSLVGVSDVVLVVVGLVTGGAGLVLMGSATHTWMMFIVPMVAAMRGCVVPVVRSMLSKSTPADMQGVLFSGVSLVEAVCTLMASVIYNSLYPVTRTVTPGFIFYLMAGALLIPFALILILELNQRGVCQTQGGRREEGDPLLGSLSSSQ